MGRPRPERAVPFASDAKDFVVLQDGDSGSAGAWLRGAALRVFPRHADYSAGWPSASRERDPAVDRGLAGPLGRQHAGR